MTHWLDEIKEMMMACETCDHTMQAIGPNGKPWWCPRCGTVLLGSVHTMDVPTGVQKVVDLIAQCGGIDGGHHKQWMLDQILRELLGETGYTEWVKDWENPEDGTGEVYEWDTGIAP